MLGWVVALVPAVVAMIAFWSLHDAPDQINSTTSLQLRTGEDDSTQLFKVSEEIQIEYSVTGDDAAPAALVFPDIFFTANRLTTSPEYVANAEKSHLRIVTVTLPGFARSSRLRGPIDSYLNGINEMLKYLGVEKAHVVGLRHGVTYAIHLASHSPSVVDSLNIVSPEILSGTGITVLSLPPMRKLLEMLFGHLAVTAAPAVEDARDISDPNLADAMRSKLQNSVGLLDLAILPSATFHPSDIAGRPVRLYGPNWKDYGDAAGIFGEMNGVEYISNPSQDMDRQWARVLLELSVKPKKLKDSGAKGDVRLIDRTKMYHALGNAHDLRRMFSMMSDDVIAYGLKGKNAVEVGLTEFFVKHYSVAWKCENYFVDADNCVNFHFVRSWTDTLGVSRSADGDERVCFGPDSLIRSVELSPSSA